MEYTLQKSKGWLLGFVLILSLFQVTTYAACMPNLDKNVQRILDEGREKYHLLGMQVSILCKGETIPHDFATGKTMLNSNELVTPHTLFQVGSITKSFTAALILILEEEGLLSIDDEIGMWLPQLPPAWKKITIKQLLNHTSGLRDYSEIDEFRYLELLSEGKKQWTPDELIQFVFNEQSRFPTGEGYYYSNTNYVLAGMIIDTVLASQGKNYADIIKTRLIEPLHLTHTYYLPSAYQNEIFNRLAHGYLILDPSLPDLIDATTFNMSYASAAGANISTAHDVSLWFKNLMHGNVLSSAQLTKMMTMVDEFTGQPVKSNGYGLGIYQYFIQNEEAWRHNGITLAHHAGMIWLKCRDIVIAYTNNKLPTGDITIDDFSEAIVAMNIITFIQQAEPAACQIPTASNNQTLPALMRHDLQF